MSDSATPGERAQVQVRRAPKFGAFLVVGGLFGFLATLIATSLFPSDPTIGFVTLLAYFSIFGITAGVIVGAIAAILIDRRSRKRARTLDAEHEIIDPSPIEGVIDEDDPGQASPQGQTDSERE